MNINVKDWECVGSGAANVVFAYIGESTSFFGKVIRLRVEGSKLSTQEIYNYTMNPQFDELRPYFLKVNILKLSFNSLMTFQKILDAVTSHSKKLKLDEQHALLLDNFLSDKICQYDIVELNKYYKFFIHKFDKEIYFEFKPKWLTKPANEYLNCRNCLNAKSKNQNFFYCHLNILERNGVESFCSSIINELQNRGFHIQGIEDMMKFAITTNIALLNTLQKLQNKINLHQELCLLNSVDDVTDELQFNMTLRDVSLIFNLKKATVCLIDLDEKSKEKWREWKLKELRYKHEYVTDLELNCGVKASK